jgi:hypothetical protein
MRSRNMLMAAVVLGVAVQLTACSGSYHVKADIRDDGSTEYVLTNNEITVEGAAKYHSEFNEGNYSVAKRCYIDLRSLQDSAGDVSYWLILTYVADEWLEIEKGRSLELTIDLNSEVLSADSELDREKDPSGKFITEILEYPVTSDVLWRMIRADAIVVNVAGRKGEVTGFFNETNFANLRKFANEHMEISAVD